MKMKKYLMKATFLLIILISGSLSCDKEEYSETCEKKMGTQNRCVQDLRQDYKLNRGFLVTPMLIVTKC